MLLEGLCTGDLVGLLIQLLPQDAKAINSLQLFALLPYTAVAGLRHLPAADMDDQSRSSKVKVAVTIF